MTLIIDTSVIIKWFVNKDGHKEALALLESGEQLICPDFALLEAANVLWRKERLSEIDREQAQSAIEAMPEFFDQLTTSTELVWQGNRKPGV